MIDYIVFLNAAYLLAPLLLTLSLLLLSFHR
jgi:hypothetical protein